MRIEDLQILLEKLREGDCSADERRIIEEWYDSLDLGADQPLREEDIARSLQKVGERLGIGADEDRPGIGEREGRPVFGIERGEGEFGRGRRWVAAAAVATLVVISGAAGWLLGGRKPVSTPSLAGRSSPDTSIVTSRGETRQIFLPDGSTIELNAGTELCYPKQFLAKGRRVTLVRGEAFFQVAAAAGKPFTVNAGRVTTVVLGTSFNIRAYEREPEIRIALVSGKIRVGEKGELRPHEMMRLDTSGTRATVSHFDEEDEVAAWKEGALRFKDASFEDIAFEIGNKYNIELRNDSRRAKWSYTGLFRNNSLQEVMETICLTENLACRFTETGVVIEDK